MKAIEKKLKVYLILMIVYYLGAEKEKSIN